MQYTLSEATARAVRELTKNRNLYDVEPADKGTQQRNNIQWLIIDGEGHTAYKDYQGYIGIYPATLIRFNSQSLEWDFLAEIWAWEVNAVPLTVDTVYLGYGQGYVEDKQLFAVGCCGGGGETETSWYCLNNAGPNQCFLLSDVALAEMLDVGYIVVSGPHDTEDECLIACLPPVTPICCEGYVIPPILYAHFHNCTDDFIPHFEGLCIRLTPYAGGEGWYGIYKVLDPDGNIGGVISFNLVCVDTSEDETPIFAWKIILSSSFMGGESELGVTDSCTIPSFVANFSQGNLGGGYNCAVVGSGIITINTDPTGALFYPPLGTVGVEALMPCAPGIMPQTLYFARYGGCNTFPESGILTWTIGGNPPVSWGGWADSTGTMGVQCNGDSCDVTDFALTVHSCLAIAYPNPTTWKSPFLLQYDVLGCCTGFPDLAEPWTLLVSDKPIIAGTHTTSLAVPFPSPDGGTTRFCFNIPFFGTPTIFMNGLVQREGVDNDYVIAYPNCIVYNIPPLAGDLLEATYSY